MSSQVELRWERTASAPLVEALLSGGNSGDSAAAVPAEVGATAGGGDGARLAGTADGRQRRQGRWSGCCRRLSSRRRRRRRPGARQRENNDSDEARDWRWPAVASRVGIRTLPSCPASACCCSYPLPSSSAALCGAVRMVGCAEGVCAATQHDCRSRVVRAAEPPPGLGFLLVYPKPYTSRAAPSSFCTY